jgi:hypothetical protein
MHRRSLLQLLGSAAAALPWRPTLAQAQASPLDEASVQTLRMIAPAVLPSEIGAKGADRVVDEFLAWLRGHRAGADMGFGYGILRKRVTPAIAPATYREQLASLKQAGVEPRTTIQARQRAIADALDASGLRDFPASPDGRHVVADFMSFYYMSSAANDLAHRARIGRDKCRALAGSSKRPEML